MDIRKHINNNKTFSIIFIFLGVFLFLFSSVTNAKVVVREDHPRLLMNQSDVEKVREAIKTYSKGNFESVKGRADFYLKKTSPDEIKSSRYPYSIVQCVAFVGLILKEEKYISGAIDYAIAIASVPTEQSEDLYQGNRLLSMAYAYDWLYDYFTAKQKMLIRQGIIFYIEQLKYFLDNPSYTGSHSHSCNIAIMGGLLALYGEYRDWHGAELLEAVKHCWEQGYNPFLSWVAKEGGHHMGWSYGSGWTSPTPYLFWEKATGERWCEDWRKKQAFWYIYGQRGSKDFPKSGDVWLRPGYWDYNYCIVNTISVCAGIFRDPYAEWFYQTYCTRVFPPSLILRIITRDPTVNPKAPFDKDAALPLYRNFRNSGYIIARDTWAESTTQLIFRSAPFYSLNHNHKDQNHIDLFYKGPLLIDSGGYDSYGSSHWYNYYTRSIAHNTMVVFDPDEVFWRSPRRGALSNDGGQKFPDSNQEPKGDEPYSLEQAQIDKYKLDGIIRESIGAGCCWVRGDATKAYHASKVKSYIRDVFMVNSPVARTHPYILVLDRIELNKKLTPKILFHFKKKPEIDSAYFAVENNKGGYLHGEILTSNVQLDLIGGKGKEWWVNGVNYPPSKSWEKKGIDAGAWRLEVGAAESAIKTEFLTLLSIDDADFFQGRPNCSLVSGDGYYGALDGKNFLLINYKEPASEEWVFSGEKYNNVQRIYIAGIDPDKKYTFKINATLYTFTSQSSVMLIDISKAPPPRR